MRKGWPLFLIAFVLVVTVFAAQQGEGVPRRAPREDSAQTEAITVLETEPEEEMESEAELLIHRPGLALVAHAGAAINGYAMSNSLEAIQNAVSLGFRYIELDMITTSDNLIVLNHSWPLISNRIPGVRDGIMTYAEFMSHRIYNQFTPADLNMLIEFLRENPGPRIITDTKDTDYAALYVIARFFPEYRHRFIPQAYAFEDVERIRALGFNDIMLTTYMMRPADLNPTVIHQFAMEEELYAVAIHEPLVVPAFVSQLGLDEMRYMVFTIDSWMRAAELCEMGFYAVYTAFLTYTDDLQEMTIVPLPIRDYADKINANIQNLDNAQQRLMSTAMFYKINLPVYVHRGGTIPVASLSQMAAPFESLLSGQVYLRTSNFIRYMQGLDWRPRERVLYITRDEHVYAVGRDDFYELFLYRDTVFISETVIKNVFGFEVLRDADFIIVVSHDNGVEAEDYFELARILFADV